MSRLSLTLACGTYDLNRGLVDGSIQPQGIDLNVLTMASPERHRRMSRSLEFDVCEFSLATYLMLHARDALPVIAIPAFPHRRFRHGYVFVRQGAGIHTPADLNGRRIGLRTWETTAGFWMRGILAERHGVDLRSIEWVTQDPEDVPFEAPSFTIERTPRGTRVTDRLIAGELDALIYPEMPTAMVQGDPRIARLFGDPRAEEVRYVQATGIFPIMHVVIVRRAILDAHPWVARSLLEAFQGSLRQSYQRLRDPRHIAMAWNEEAIAEQDQILGPDPWAYDFERNLTVLDTMIRYASEQEMIERPFAASDLFAPSVLEPLPTYV